MKAENHSGDEYTDEEKRNLAVLREWIRCWNTPGLAGKMVDDLYAETCEVLTPLQSLSWSLIGESKQDWRDVEIAYDDAVRHREMTLLNKIVKGNVIAVEVRTVITSKTGETFDTGFMAFLWFENGRIVRDHTYQRPPNIATPELMAATEKIRRKRKVSSGS